MDKNAKSALALILIILLSHYAYAFKKIKSKSSNTMFLSSKSKMNISSYMKMNTKNTVRDDGPVQPNCANSYFGSPFACLSTDGLPTQTSMVPTTVMGGYTKIYQAMYSMGNNYNFCMGDLTGDNLHEQEQTKCEAIPLNSDNNYAALGGVVYNFNCGLEEPQTVAACVAFDTCGTFAVSIDGGIVRCVAGLFPGIGNIVSAVSESLDFVSFGISVDKQFSMPLTIFTYSPGSGAGTIDVSTQGHFYLAAGLTFPQQIFGDIEFLAEAVSLDVTGTFMIDFGNNSSNQIGSINSYSDTTKNNNMAVSFIQNLLTSGEVSASLSGSLTINLNELTHGVMPNLEFDLGELDCLITSGGGASGQPAGFYLYAESGLDFFMALLNTIFGAMGKLFSLVGISSIPGINSGDSFGVFVNSNYAGFTFGFTLIDSESIYCIYDFTKDSGSCGVQGFFLTFLYNVGKWIINEVEDIWGDVVNALGEFDQDLNNLANEVAQDIVNVANDIGSGIVTAADDIGDFFEDLFGGGCSSSNNTQYSGYNQSCTGCQMMNPNNSNDYPHYLQCNCKNASGSVQSTTIDVAQCFGNVNGILTWRKTGCYDTQYYQTCVNCLFSGSLLMCTCKENGSNSFYDLAASVDLNNYIGNQNGNLQC